MPEQLPFHAIIVTGPAERTRERAREMAMSLVCSGDNPPCEVCRDCRKAAADIHPDVIPAERFMDERDRGGQIKIDAVRALRADAFVKPNEAARKVYILDGADRLNLNAQNALLKLLEEGPEYDSFLLLTDKPGALLETVRSRCAVLSAGVSEEGAPTDSNALRYAELLAKGSELDRMAFLARLETEKPDADALEQFLTDLEQLFSLALRGSATGVLEGEAERLLAEHLSAAELSGHLDQIRKFRTRLPYHVAAGHLLGALGAQSV